MRQAGSEPIHEFVQHELAVHETLRIVGDFFRDILKELSLHATQRFRSAAATMGELWIRLFPLAQLMRTLPLYGTHLIAQLFQQEVLTFLIGDNLAQ